VITFPVSLAKPAPAGGVTVTLTSSNPNVVPILPDTMFIAEGATVPAVQALVGALIPGSAIITATAPGFGTATQGVQAVTPAISVTWYGACWATATIYGYAGNYQAMDFAMTVSNPAPIQGTLYFNATCDPAGGSDNMNDYGLVYGSVHKVQGFSHHPDEIPTSALYWIGPRTTDGRCAPGSPCSGCVVYNKNTPNCSDMP